MNHSIIDKFNLFYKIYIAPPKVWILPKKTDILIYDCVGSEIILQYLEGKNRSIFPVRGESINMPCFFLALITLNFWKKNSFVEYSVSYIKKVQPKLVITFIDNNPNFYVLSKRLSFCKTVFLQNGSRSEFADIFDTLVKNPAYQVDYMFVHGKEIGRHYQNYISGDAIPIGSLKNNHYVKKRPSEKFGIIFISSWRKKSDNKNYFYKDPAGKDVSWDLFYSAEARILEFLDLWCFYNNKTLIICGCEIKETSLEERYFQSLLLKCNWKYIKKTNSSSSYDLIDKGEIVATIDSTLGYESLGRGNKTVFFSSRGSAIDSNAARFGWPLLLPEDGPFWSNSSNASNLEKVMDYVASISDEEWMAISRPYASKLMLFDEGNNIFRDFLNTAIS